MAALCLSTVQAALSLFNVVKFDVSHPFLKEYYLRLRMEQYI